MAVTAAGSTRHPGGRRRLSRLAGAAPVPVLPVLGAGGRDRLVQLLADEALCVADSPRHAVVLLLVGRLPAGLLEAVAAVHDQLPHPRAVVWWLPDEPEPRRHDPPGLAPGSTVVTGADVVSGVVAAARAVLDGSRASSASLLPERNPVAWRGVGPHGQGGEGMMGGVPYGRGMAMTADDRDGLPLDALSLPLGPVLPGFPPGLVLQVQLQGDLVQDVQAVTNLFDDGGQAPPPDVFALALSQPVPIRALELARARSQLAWVAGALRLHGLPALGMRVARLAVGLSLDDGPAVRRLGRRLLRHRTLAAATRGVGIVAVESCTGPVAAAAGRRTDPRGDDPAYQALDFRALTQDGADVHARLRQRLREAEQAVDLAAAAGERSTTPVGAVAAPDGTLTAERCGTTALMAGLPELLRGLEWGDALRTLHSLDLDLERAARVAAHAELG